MRTIRYGLSILLMCTTIISTVYAIETNTMPPTIAVGWTEPYPNSVPLLLVYSENQNIWEKKSIKGAKAGQHLSHIDCGKGSSSLFCVAIGWGTAETRWGPVIAVSQDSGLTWNMKKIDSYTNETQLRSLSCAGAYPSTICVAVGHDNSIVKPKEAPLITSSHDGGETWQVKYEDVSEGGGFRDISCTGENEHIICTAIGLINKKNDKHFPLLVVSTNSAKTWERKSITGFPENSYLTSVSCTGSGNKAICIAVGYGLSDQQLTPIVVASKDGGDTWQIKSIEALPETGALFNVHCTGEGTSAICVAGGGEALYNSKAPLLAQSIDGGETWKTVSINGIPENGYFNSVNCNNNSNPTICIAAGTSGLRPDVLNINPLIAASHDGGKTWEIKTMGLPERGGYAGVKCKEINFSIQCIAVGSGQKHNYYPLLSLSMDAGNTWVSQSSTKYWDTDAELKSIY